MKLISFFPMRVREIFVSLRNYLLEIADGLKENRLNKTGCEKVKSGKLPGLSAVHWRTHIGIERHKISHSQQILFLVCTIFSQGAELCTSMLGHLGNS